MAVRHLVAPTPQPLAVRSATGPSVLLHPGGSRRAARRGDTESYYYAVVDGAVCMAPDWRARTAVGVDPCTSGCARRVAHRCGCGPMGIVPDPHRDGLLGPDRPGPVRRRASRRRIRLQLVRRDRARWLFAARTVD